MLYENRVKEKLKRAQREDCVVLGIETSCDDTSAAVVRGGRECLSLCVNSQIDIHKEFGGVVPELASRNHVLNLSPVVNAALSKAKLELCDIDAVAVTSSPGLLGALLTGVNYAKGLAYAAEIPFVGVNHIAGHVAANYLTHSELTPPFICLVASGGHSQVLYVKSYCEYDVLSGTCDDAAGEALDKIARSVGLPYPGGVHLERLAREGNEEAYGFRAEFNTNDNPNFSFSGIKTAVINVLNTAKQRDEEINIADIAASFQRAVTDTLIHKTLLAAKEAKVDTIALAGGVSANLRLREKLAERAEELGANVYCPALEHCGDNGAMIACAGYYMMQNGQFSDLSLDACAAD